jgi:hypothetical protein
MATNSNYYQAWAINELVNCIDTKRKELLFELVSNANNPVVFKRRCRMIKQLCTFESQIITKINRFNTNNLQDYESAVATLLNEIKFVTSRNA